MLCVENISHPLLDANAEEYLFQVSHLDIESGTLLVIESFDLIAKTSFLKMLLGLVRPKNGAISLFGKNPYDFTEPQRYGMIGYYGTALPLNRTLTVKENLITRCGNHPYDETHAKSLFADFHGDYDASAGQNFGEVNTDEQQRIRLIAAFINDADCVILDNVFENIDAGLAASLGALLEKKCQQGKILILSSIDGISLPNAKHCRIADGILQEFEKTIKETDAPGTEARNQEAANDENFNSLLENDFSPQRAFEENPAQSDTDIPADSEIDTLPAPQKDSSDKNHVFGVLTKIPKNIFLRLKKPFGRKFLNQKKPPNHTEPLKSLEKNQQADEKPTAMPDDPPPDNITETALESDSTLTEPPVPNMDIDMTNEVRVHNDAPENTAASQSDIDASEELRAANVQISPSENARGNAYQPLQQGQAADFHQPHSPHFVKEDFAPPQNDTPTAIRPFEKLLESIPNLSDVMQHEFCGYPQNDESSDAVSDDAPQDASENHLCGESDLEKNITESDGVAPQDEKENTQP